MSVAAERFALKVRLSCYDIRGDGDPRHEGASARIGQGASSARRKLVMPGAIRSTIRLQPAKAVVKKATPRKRIKKVDAATIDRLVAEAERGIPEQKLRRRGRPSIGEEASSTYSVRLPDELVTLVDERSAVDGITRGETVRRALIAYLTK